MDGDGQLDFVVGTSVGFLYVFDQTGQMLQNFPVTMDEIHTQVLVADVFNDRRMHLIAADRSGNVVLFNSQAEEVRDIFVVQINEWGKKILKWLAAPGRFGKRASLGTPQKP